MAKDSQRLELDFIEKAHNQTGKAIPEWMTVIAASGLDKQAVIHK